MKQISADQFLYRIDAARFHLQVGDPITPGQVLGEDTTTGELIRASSYGRVEAVYFSGADHALLILVRAEARAAEPAVDAGVVRHKIEASWCPVRVGEQVTPETAIGNDAATGEPVLAGIHGVVEAIGFSGADHALNVVIRSSAV
jgi:hypothetical protein